jgi:hypothetical protein
MADDIDNAMERIEAFNAVAISAVLDRPEAPLSDGICKTCGEAIEPDRLKANPRARDCAWCAAEALEVFDPDGREAFLYMWAVAQAGAVNREERRHG